MQAASTKGMSDTITAQATPPGRGGVGIIRVSGPLASTIAAKIIGHCPKARQAQYVSFRKADKSSIDEGIALFFQGPHSFTGEDVLELQGHGGPVVMDMLLNETLAHGARLARPGEFSERAFLNNKLDLTQAEAIADLIDAASEQAAKMALRSLQGDFSEKINQLVEQVTHLRMYVEAAIDFPEEEIDFLADHTIFTQFEEIEQAFDAVLQQTTQGTLMREGMKMVIAGRPNAGKSSLLNALAGRQSAIVTDIAGTTRDVLREEILLNGLPVHIVDTAGLRESTDIIEQEGVKRARNEMRQADHLLLVVDQAEFHQLAQIKQECLMEVPENIPITVVVNKIDLTKKVASIEKNKELTTVYLSAKQGQGIDLLRQHLLQSIGFSQLSEGNFIARRRHLDALKLAKEALEHAKTPLQQAQGELLAEDLRSVQNALGEITGKVTADALLGKIFSSFCIGK